MKKFLTLFAVITLALAAIASAAAPVLTLGPARPWRLQLDLAWDDAGTLTAATPQIFYRKALTVDGVAQTPVDAGSVSWNAVARKDETLSITLSNGETGTVTRGALLAALLANVPQ